MPIEEATNQSLLYYGATLLSEGDIVRFSNQDYPIWKMELGTRYVDDYLMTKKGKGFYLEWHNDRPHWHQPVTRDAGGFYLLAKKIPNRSIEEEGKDQSLMDITAFSIPYGKAVYTRMGVIHCDSGLTG